MWSILVTDKNRKEKFRFDDLSGRLAIGLVSLMGKCDFVLRTMKMEKVRGQVTNVLILVDERGN